MRRNQEPIPQTARQCRRFQSPKRLPPTNPEFAPPCWRVRALFEPPRVHRALPPGPRFRHAFTRLQRARSERLTGCSPGAAGPRAVRRFLQLCGSPSTTSDSPNPAGVFSEAEAPAPWVARIPCGPRQPDRPRPGVARYVFLVACRAGAHRAVRTRPTLGRSRDPRISVRGADTDLPRPDNDPDTPCRLLVRAEPGKSVSACDRAEHPRVKNVWDASSVPRLEGQLAYSRCRSTESL